MGVKGVLRNIRRKGIRRTLEIRREREAKRARDRWIESRASQLERYYLARPFLELEGEERQKMMDEALELEQTLKAERRRTYKAVHKRMKACYIKERLPEAYARASKAPVADKVVFVENGGCPSPSNAHLISVLESQGNYEVVKIGLGRRRVSELEYYENCLAFAEAIGDAKAIFITTANDLLCTFDVRPETKVIQLWHGLGMFKKVGHSTAENPHFGKSASDREEYDQYRNYSYVTLPAASQAWVFEDAMHIPQDSGVLVDVGVSRTDVFYQKSYLKRSLAKLHEAIPQSKDKKVILYAPTFRGHVGGAQAPDALDVGKLADALADDYILLIKYHGLSREIPEVPEEYRGTFAFDLTRSGFMSIDRLLSVADIMITDYSSLGFEYSILERPMLFFAYDLEDYIDKRGIYYDYEEITPGPVCRTNEEMIDYILHVDERFDKQQVVDFKRKHVGACDGHATERTIKLIEGIVESPGEAGPPALLEQGEGKKRKKKKKKKRKKAAQQAAAQGDKAGD